MTNLNTNIPLEVVQQSKKLQGVKTLDFYDCNGELTNCIHGSSIKSKKNSPGLHIQSADIRPNIPAPTISDVINNAQFLFNIEMYQWSEDFNFPAKIAQNNILKMCQQNNSIEEISAYMLKNIKEC